MKLSGRYRIVVEGDTDAFLSAGGRNRDILRYQLERMVAGEEFSPDELAYWSIKVSQEPDERARIVAYLREIAEDSADEDALKHAANSIEAGLDRDEEL